MQRTSTHESQYASSLIEASLDPLFTISTGGKITDMNQATMNATGATREQLTGSDFFRYFTEQEKARAVYEEIFAKGFVTNYPLTIKDHRLTDVLFNGSVYKDTMGNVLGAVLVARDITEQNRISAELTKAIVRAEEAKTKAEHATHLAEDAVKAKQQFLSNMSHEIRTPMNAIIGFTKVVLKTNLSAKQKEYVTAIKISGDALIVLINDILDLAKVDSGKMTFEETPFRLAVSVSAMLHLFETKIQEKNLELVIEYDNTIPEVLTGDPVRLHQIILNLVSNAVKFTGRGVIRVGIKMLSEDDHTVTIRFSISDTGIGIAQHKLKDIFENFQQASSVTSRLYGGTGLGLAIVKQLVETQGGSITVESTLNEGSTFSFILSFNKAESEDLPEQEILELDPAIKGVKVLVVEDIPLNQLLMKTLLDDFGFEWDIAANGKIAIEKLRKASYNIILMDLQMPEMNGFEATEYIRNTLHSNIPIIALTADVTTVDVEKCRSVGMNDYIAKPVGEKSLYSKIIGQLKRAAPVNSPGTPNNMETPAGKKYIDLSHLVQRTRANPRMILEMIALYLEQTPALVTIMKESYLNKDWNALQAAVHKMVPSFSIVGIHRDFENMARKIQDYASARLEAHDIEDMILKVAEVCLQSCSELEAESKNIKNRLND